MAASAVFVLLTGVIGRVIRLWRQSKIFSSNSVRFPALIVAEGYLDKPHRAALRQFASALQRSPSITAIITRLFAYSALYVPGIRIHAR